ncbi:MAG: hypothetical protein R3299_05015 [Arenibacter sp.]|nr:hypothetical protein [Arenibacter sp.]
MKKLVFTMVLLLGFTAFAQTGNRKGMKDLTPQQMATLQTKKMTLALDLTDAQQAQIQKLNLENATARVERRKEIQAKRESGEIKPLSSEQRYELRVAHLDHQIAQRQQLQKILSKEQFIIWNKINTKRKSHRMAKAKKARHARRH